MGYGASSRNAGQVLTGLRLGPSTLVHRYGESRARQLFDASIAAIDNLERLVAAESIDCEYERTGHILAAWKPSHFESFREEQAVLSRVFNHRVELVGKRDQRREIGSDRYHGVLVDERSASINPARYVAGLAAAATRAGAALACGVDVKTLRGDAGHGWIIGTAHGPIQARDVLIATNGYTGPATPELRKRLLSIGSFIIVTEPLSESQARSVLPTHRMAFDSKHFLYYFRLTPDRRLLFGGRATFAQASESDMRDAAEILRRGLAEIFPQLRDVPIAYSWGGRIAIARDERPHAGRLADGTYFAAGYAGHGIAMATMLGELTARRIAGEPIEHPFVDDRCPSIPLYNGTPWFLPVVGAYFQVMDWIS